MKLKNLLIVTLMMGLLWSCGKSAIDYNDSVTIPQREMADEMAALDSITDRKGLEDQCKKIASMAKDINQKAQELEEDFNGNTTFRLSVIDYCNGVEGTFNNPKLVEFLLFAKGGISPEETTLTEQEILDIATELQNAIAKEQNFLREQKKFASENNMMIEYD